MASSHRLGVQTSAFFAPKPHSAESVAGQFGKSDEIKAATLKEYALVANRSIDGSQST